MKKLPIGISTFRKIIEGGYLYIDKTKDIYRMINEGELYFLSRPRRFGKSLLVSTLAEIFSGNKELFKGLWIYESDWKWEKYPVIRLDMSKMKVNGKEELKIKLKNLILQIAESFKIELRNKQFYDLMFDELIIKTAELTEKKKVVILIDEYDKPIIDNITNREEVIGIRDILKGFYGVMKAEDEYIRFIFMTGVSKFSKAGVFSELNNLDDITMSNRFSTMLGITQEELERYFTEHIEAVAEEMGISKEEVIEGIREWYNGYCFSRRCEKVYNPFSTMKFFSDKEFSNYWFETGTPKFLIDLIKERDYDLTEIPAEVKSTMFSTYEVEDLEILPLLFQTGYLTITGYKDRYYRLDYPNREVKESFCDEILKVMGGIKDRESVIKDIKEKIEANDIEGMMEEIKYVLMNLPYPIREGRHRYYQSIVYLIFLLLGYEVKTEVATYRGRIDVEVELNNRVYIFEVKIDGGAEEGIKQARERGYGERHRGKEIWLIGIGINSWAKSGAEAIEWKIERW